jgi:RNA polymerase sigma factor (sigma-70 family)
MFWQSANASSQRERSITVTASATHSAIDAVWRIESAKVIAGLARMVRDVGLAEELAQDALLAALETWPGTGVPDNPGAWLMATAKNRALDLFRRDKLLERKHEELAGERELEQEIAAADREAALIERMDDDIGDDLLRLVFVACHPVLSTEARAALTLRLLCGLTTDEIARAFLVPEPTIAQRIVRAKSSTSSSTKATRRPLARTGCGPRSARRRCVWVASSPSSPRASPRSTASSR